MCIRDRFCEVNPIPVKEAMNLMGKDVGPFRMPLCEMEPKNRERLEAAMKAYGTVSYTHLGSIVAISGISDIHIGDTLCSPENPEAIPCLLYTSRCV